MKRWVCTNCGFWQSDFHIPKSCPVCRDFRHTPPDDGWHFLDFAQAKTVAETTWREDAGVWIFGSLPKWGIGPSGYFLPRPSGNIFFESCPFYSPDALDFLENQGGVSYFAASHPHSYGGGWQLRERFLPKVAVQLEDLPWTNEFSTDCPFNEELDLGDGARLIHTGGHFAGHSVLHLQNEKILFAGDMLKFHFDESGICNGISTHKGFNRRIPMTHAEIRRYREVIANLDFERIYTTFERGPDNSKSWVLKLFDEQLNGPPFFGPMRLDNSR